MGTRIKTTVKGPLDKPHPALILDPPHMKAIGETIAAPLRTNLAAGRDADGQALAPEVGRGDGIPGHETGVLAASIKARRTSKGKLVVMPDYKAYQYGIYLATGVDKVATLKAQIAGKMRKRRDYKTDVDRKQAPRPFMGMSRPTLDKVAKSNEGRFKEWVENINPRGGLNEAPGGLGVRPGGLARRPGAV